MDVIQPENKQNDESFRDSVSSIGKDGKRKWIYPLKQKGAFFTKRTIASIIYLVLFFTLPFIKVNGDPLLLLNILDRKFILFGYIFMPQDMFLFALAMLTFMVFIVLFTVAFGRLFCGWACPQTVFMEMVFRKIEYLIEGDASAQRKLARSSWNAEKIRKKGLKWLVFAAISFVIANFFLAYIIGMDQLIKIISDPLSQHVGGFISILAFTGVFFFVFTYMREQVCLVVCPYGRLQGVLLDKNSVVVAYDYKRGEPRGKLKRGDTTVKGDCIDCFRCVNVCPTGIDIRNGTQLECINCTACIDACDQIMESVNRPKGLIRYASENMIAKGEKLRLSLRIVGYSAILLALLFGLGIALATRSNVDVTVLRAAGTLYQEVAPDSLSNLYSYTLSNKTRDELIVTPELVGIKGRISMVGHDKTISLNPEGLAKGSFFIILPQSEIKARKNELKLEFYAGDKLLESTETTFLAPVTRN